MCELEVMMQSRFLFKRKRGGQPGNRNAAGNPGNKNARGTIGNRGGGAPVGNQNARKRSNGSLEILQRDYGREPEAVEWMRQRADDISKADIRDDDQRDAVIYSSYLGLTLEALAAQGREYKLGLYTLPDEEDDDE